MSLLKTVKLKLSKYHLDPFVDVGLFIIILLVFHVIWKLLATNIMAVDFINNSATFLAREVFHASEWFLNLINVNVVSFDQLDIDGVLKHNVFYYAENNGFVYVNRSCSGLKQFYQWTFLILLYPGPWKKKLWYWPMGLLVTHFVNILRIVGMVFVTMYIPEKWSFIHDYVFRPFFYIVMFALWAYWNERFYLKSEKTS